MKHQTNKTLLFLTLLTIFSLCSLATYAQNSQRNIDTTNIEKRNSISLSSFILLGSVQLNYERLIGSRHGVLAEGYYSFAGSSKQTLTVGCSYRYHFKPSLKGLFINGFFRYGDVYNTSTFAENGSSKTYEMQTNLKLIGLGLGNRWQWKNGFAVVVRGGYGYQINPVYKWSPSIPLDNTKKYQTEATQGLDLEISAGYSF